MKSVLALIEFVLNVIAELFKSLLRYALMAALLFASLITFAVLMVIHFVR